MLFLQPHHLPALDHHPLPGFDVFEHRPVGPGTGNPAGFRIHVGQNDVRPAEMSAVEHARIILIAGGIHHHLPVVPLRGLPQARAHDASFKYSITCASRSGKARRIPRTTSSVTRRFPLRICDHNGRLTPNARARVSSVQPNICFRSSTVSINSCAFILVLLHLQHRDRQTSSTRQCGSAKPEKTKAVFEAAHKPAVRPPGALTGHVPPEPPPILDLGYLHLPQPPPSIRFQSKQTSDPLSHRYLPDRSMTTLRRQQ